MKEGMNHINTQSVVPQQCPSLLSTKQRTKAGCCLAWAPPRWLTGTVKSSEASERSAYAAFMAWFSSLQFSVSTELVAVLSWMPAYILEDRWGRAWTEANILCSQISGWLLHFRNWKWIFRDETYWMEEGHKPYKVMKIWNHIFTAEDDFKHSLRKQAMWNCVVCSNGKL